MNAYTVSRLALEAGVSVHIVRDYLLRGLLRPVACTTGGYGLFDDAALQRLCFVRAAFEAGIGLDALARLCRALDAADCDETAAQLAVLSQFVERRREALADLEGVAVEFGKNRTLRVLSAITITLHNIQNRVFA